MCKLCFLFYILPFIAPLIYFISVINYFFLIIFSINTSTSVSQSCDFTCRHLPGCICSCMCMTCALCTSCLLEVRNPQHKYHELVDASLVIEDAAFGKNFIEPITTPSSTSCANFDVLNTSQTKEKIVSCDSQVGQDEQVLGS